MSARLRIKDQIFELTTTSLTWGEAAAIERTTGMLFGEYERQLAAGSAVATQAMILMLWRRVEPGVSLADLDKIGTDEVELIPEAPAATDEPAKPNRAARRANPTKAA